MKGKGVMIIRFILNTGKADDVPVDIELHRSFGFDTVFAGA